MSLKSLAVAVLVSVSTVAIAAGTTATTTTTTTTIAGKAATTPAATTPAATAAVTLKPADSTAVSFDKVTLAEADGKLHTVKGKIVGTHCEKDICFLNFHTDYRKYVSVVVKGTDFEKFAKIEGSDMQAKMDWFTKQPGVQVTGTVTKYEGKTGARPQIMLTTADMIRPTTAN